MDCIAYLSKLLANFVYLQYKIHSLHTDMARSPIFMQIHLLLDDVYQFFGDDNIDWIKERARILGGYTPASIFELSKLTDVQELKTCPAMPEILHMVLLDLKMMEELLDAGVKATADDMVTQNQLINFQDAVGVFRWKIEMSIPNEVLPTNPKK